MELTKEQQFYAEIVQKAWDDAEFKKELIASPIEAIERLTGKKVNPENKRASKIIVEDQTNSSIIYLNIPRKINYADLELTEEQLEAVAGGGWVYDQGEAFGKWVKGLFED